MKRNRIIRFATLLASMSLLTACNPIDWIKNLINGGGNSGEIDLDDYDVIPEFASGTAAEQKAILEAINYKKPVTTKSNNTVFPDVTGNLTEDAGDYVILSTKQLMGDLTVEYEWEIDTTQATLDKVSDTDEYHKVIEFNYPGFGNPNTEFTWSMKKATCGSAVTSKTNCNYKVALVGEKNLHGLMTIGEIQAVTEGDYETQYGTYPSRFDVLNYDQEKPWPKANPLDPEANQRFLSVLGKIIYYAPDGNWLLLANGDEVTEVYTGAGTPLTPAKYPAMNDQYVKVYGQVAGYRGNIQIGIIENIKTATAAEKATIAEPTLAVRNIDDTFIKTKLDLEGKDYQRQAVSGCFSNCLAHIEGTVKAGSYADDLDSKGNPTGKRFTFVVNVGEREMKVAYDYHIDNNGKDSSGFKTRLKTLAQTDNAAIKLTGTMRYSNSKEKVSEGCFGLVSGGEWNIVPFLPEHIA